jgi:O-antigen/teichoic acid export membrane protein
MKPLCDLGLGAAGIVTGMRAGSLAVVISDLPHHRQRLQGAVLDVSLDRQIAGFGVRIALVYLFEYVIVSADKLLIAHFLNAGILSIYSVSYRLADRAASSVFLELTLSGYPMIIRARELEGIAAALRQADRSVRILLTLALPGLGGFLVVLARLAKLLLGPQYATVAVGSEFTP